MNRVIGAALLGAVMLASTPAIAQAHTELIASSPRNGAQVLVAPGAISLTFGEAVSLDAIKPTIIASAGAVPLSMFALNGATLTLTPARALSPGNYAATWHVVSDDGHPVSGAIAFTVGKSSLRGGSASLATTPHVPATLNSSRAGPLTVTLAKGAQAGTVTWTNAALPEPITWRVIGTSHKATASGVLPLGGVWTMQATLEGAGGSVVVVSGSVALR